VVRLIARRPNRFTNNCIVKFEKNSRATRGPGHPGPRAKTPNARILADHPQRAGIASPHAAGDGLSGARSDRESFAFISDPTGVVGGVPLTRAMNPWAMPEASTKRPVIFPCELIPLSDVKADPG